MQITGRIEMNNDENYINSPKGRYEAYLKRDDKIYCKFHPRIHPDNIEQIKLQDGSIGYTKNKVIYSEHFRYCPKCNIVEK